MKIIIPMAGLGTRFAKNSDKNPEYKKPKPFIEVRGIPMIRWATGSLPFIEHKEKYGEVKPEDLTFIILKDHNDEYHLADGLKEIYSPKINIVILDTPTRGAGETVYMARNYIDLEDDLLITDSDHFFNGKYLYDAIKNKHQNTAGIIPVFMARNEGIPKWSYSLVGDDNIISKVAEKDRNLMELGAHANIGAYYFSKGNIFIDQIEENLKNNEMYGDEGKKEFYIAPLYQKLIEKGMKIQAAIVPEVWGLGTPSDLEYFIDNADIQNPWYE